MHMFPIHLTGGALSWEVKPLLDSVENVGLSMYPGCKVIKLAITQYNTTG